MSIWHIPRVNSLDKYSELELRGFLGRNLYFTLVALQRFCLKAAAAVNNKDKSCESELEQ